MQPIIKMPEDWAMVIISNMHKKFGKDHACGSGDILADRQSRQTDRQTHTHRQTYSSQYYATAPTGKVTSTTSAFLMSLSTRYSSCWLCCVIRTVSADVTHPLQARQSFKVIVTFLRAPSICKEQNNTTNISTIMKHGKCINTSNIANIKSGSASTPQISTDHCKSP